MAISGPAMMLKSMGVDVEGIQTQIQAFGEGVKAFDKRLTLIYDTLRATQESILYLDAKIDALHRDMGERIPLTPEAMASQFGAMFTAAPSAGGVMMDTAAVVATRQSDQSWRDSYADENGSARERSLAMLKRGKHDQVS